MCYNYIKSSCRITIKSCGADWEDNRISGGELTVTEKDAEVFYTLDGDECVLTCSADKAVQKREGAQNVYLTFEKGKTTLCKIGAGGMSGEFPVLTKTLKFTSGKGGIKLSLEYVSGSDGELVKLSFVAAFNR